MPCLPLPLDWTGLGGTGLDKNKNKYKNKEIKKIILKLLVLNKIKLYFNYKKNIYIILKNINNVIWDIISLIYKSIKIPITIGSELLISSLVLNHFDKKSGK